MSVIKARSVFIAMVMVSGGTLYVLRVYELSQGKLGKLSMLIATIKVRRGCTPCL
jgi:hypothetical protein